MKNPAETMLERKDDHCVIRIEFKNRVDHAAARKIANQFGKLLNSVAESLVAKQGRKLQRHERVKFGQFTFQCNYTECGTVAAEGSEPLGWARFPADGSDLCPEHANSGWRPAEPIRIVKIILATSPAPVSPTRVE